VRPAINSPLHSPTSPAIAALAETLVVQHFMCIDDLPKPNIEAVIGNLEAQEDDADVPTAMLVWEPFEDYSLDWLNDQMSNALNNQLAFVDAVIAAFRREQFTTRQRSALLAGLLLLRRQSGIERKRGPEGKDHLDVSGIDALFAALK
jgi:hypothetical protein